MHLILTLLILAVIKSNMVTFWGPIAPRGYVALGHIAQKVLLVMFIPISIWKLGIRTGLNIEFFLKRTVVFTINMLAGHRKAAFDRRCVRSRNGRAGG